MRPCRSSAASYAYKRQADAGYKSYLSECHIVYRDKPDSFFSGQELEPEMYEPFVKIQQLASVSPFEIKIPAVDPTTKLDLVPHILATDLRIGNLHNKYVFNLTQAEPIP